MTDTPQPDYRALLTRSLRAIEQLEAKLAAVESARSEPIAVVGMACRFPGHANDLASYWSLLARGGDAVTLVPRHRWDAEALYDPDPDAIAKSYTKWGAFIDDVETFDAAFFGISPREAASLDPQQRVLLEVTWEALEHAAIAPSSLAGTRASVFLGISTSDYVNLIGEQVGTRFGDAYAASGSAHSVASGRLSYFLGAHGPNYAVDTACSSSMVAIHGAIQSLRNGETSLAIAGGVNLTLSSLGSILTSRARMMSRDGHCKAFDESADGYVRGEGCGMLVLKRVSDAERDGDRILGLLRGSAINQDGRSSGLTAPNGTAQESVIRDALANARLTPQDISLIEAHGTGTPLGDPIEMKALGAVFGARPSDQPLLVGSVKSNIGHLEAAAGVAGVIKLILAMQHELIPPHLHFRTPNRLIPWDTLPVRVPTVPTPWRAQVGAPRRAGVSSFGFSGTNSHLILEEAPSARVMPDEVRPARAQLLVLSAQNANALRAQAAQYQTFLQTPEASRFGDVAFTAAVGRSHLPERLAVVAEGAEAAAHQLAQYLSDGAAPGVHAGRFTSGTAPEIAFLFSGQGAQYPGMARELYETEAIYRSAIDACAAIVDPLLPSPLVPVIMGDEGMGDSINDTAFTQPALFAVEFALAQLWKSWGVEPAVVMGHSVGEYVAACLAGVFSLEDGLRLIAARGRLMSALPRDGAMAAIFTSRDRVEAALRGHEMDVDVAAVNGPTNIVISGQADIVDAILATLQADGVEFARLNVSHAFHSPMMEPMLEEFERIASGISYSTPVIGLVSNVTGRMAADEVATAAYWRQHVRSAVRFAESIATLHAENIRTFVEVGPAPVLIGMAQRCPGGDDAVWLASLKKGRSDRESLLESVGRLHLGGQPIVWAAVNDGGARRVDLPTYPFQRERYWFDATARAAGVSEVAGRPTGHPLLGTRLSSPLHLFQSSLSIATTPWLGDHRIYGAALLPAAAFMDLALTAGREVFGTDDVALADASLREGLTVPDSGTVTLQTIATPVDDVTLRIQICSAHRLEEGADTAADWRTHLEVNAVRATLKAPESRLPSLPAEDREDVDVEDYYERLAEQGALYGPGFRGIKALSRSRGEVLGELILPDALGDDRRRYAVHPAMLDAAIQLVGVGVSWGEGSQGVDDVFLPIGLGSYRVFRAAPAEAWCHVNALRVNAAASSISTDFLLLDHDGATIAAVEGLELHRVSRAAMLKSRAREVRPDWLLEVEWQEAPLDGTPETVSGNWLIVSDGNAVASDLLAQLRQRGARAVLLQQGPTSCRTSDGATVNFTDPEQFRSAVLEQAVELGGRWAGVVSIVGAAPPMANPDMVTLSNAHAHRIGALLSLVPAIAESAERLWIVTHGTQAVADVLPNLEDAPIWGLANVIAAEYPALRVSRIDLDPVPRRDTAESLLAAILASDDEARVALRGGLRYTARLAHGVLVDRTVLPPRRLEITERGTLANLALEVVPREEPGPGQVEVRVHATGLNFRDVLNALGMYPGDPGPLGNECAGVITAVGEGVDGLSVGDEVVAMIDRSFSTYVIAPAILTVRKPANLSFVEAATIPVTFLTAEYALSTLAGMKRGDKVLIHAATGGVGMAAIQLARREGAVILGTAGTPAKQELAAALGADHVSDSRSLRFVEDFAQATNGEGVDIVLNSLAGDFIPSSLGLLKRGGHFIEIGKTGIWDTDTVTESFPGVHYHPLYLGEIAQAEPQLVHDMLQRLMDDFAGGVLTPLPPTVYPLERAEDAFRFMSQGLHTGKIVITQERTPAVRNDASYMITGGLGGLGLACAEWLAALGARSVVLVGRRPPGVEAMAKIEGLRERGVTVTAVAADVADVAQVGAVLAEIAATLPPLRGILHAAGIVDDGMLDEQTLGRFEGVMRPKVQGTWNLHHLTLALPIDFFVLFSSGAALLGSPGQSNYAAANSFLDAVAYHRRARGRHAVSINWGSWAEVGMAADVGEAHRRRWASQGLNMITPDEGVRMLQDILQRSVSPNVAALPLDTSKLPQSAGRFFERLVRTESKVGPATAVNDGDVLRRLGKAPLSDRPAMLSEFLVDQVVRVLALPSAARARLDVSLMDIGMDSLTAMELRNRVQAALKVRLAVGDLLRGPSISELTMNLLAQLDGADDGGTVPIGTPSSTAQTHDPTSALEAFDF